MPDLIDKTDGENQAVRCFLMVYNIPPKTIGAMRNHMVNCGYPFWPDWVDTVPTTFHLTKGGAQSWLRHLFNLETHLES